MKKKAKLISVIVFALIISTLATGCGIFSKKEPVSKQPIVIGIWDVSIGMDEIVKNTVKKESPADADIIDKYFDFTGIAINAKFTFQPNGTLKIDFTDKNLDAVLIRFREVVKSGLLKYFKEYAGDGTEIEIESIITSIEEQSGQSLDEMIDAVISREALDINIANTLSYQVENNRLYLWEDGSEKNSENYLTYQLSDETMTITECTDGLHAIKCFELISKALPATMTKDTTD